MGVRKSDCYGFKIIRPVCFLFFYKEQSILIFKINFFIFHYSYFEIVICYFYSEFMSVIQNKDFHTLLYYPSGVYKTPMKKYPPGFMQCYNYY